MTLVDKRSARENRGGSSEIENAQGRDEVVATVIPMNE